MEETIKPKARDNIHTRILSWFEDKKRGTLLDAPAGYGHLSMQLKKMGFSVMCGEIEPEIFKVEGLDCIYTDLNAKIDAPDNTFDYVCCVDGLEHMLNPYRTVEEFTRVLKPGGIGVFSIPNYSNIEKRIKFLLKGYLTKPARYEDYLKANSNLFNFHNSPLTITMLDFMFRINNLKVLEILKNAPKKKQYAFFPLVLLLRFLAVLSSQKSKKKHRYDLTLSNDVLFGGNNFIFITQKN